MAESNDVWLDYLRELIIELRNHRDVEDNFPVFRSLVEESGFLILETWDLRWLISICDTYADYGTPVERRNALLVSLFVNLFRIADTYLITQNCTDDHEMINILSQQQIPLSLLNNEANGVMTLSLAKQDTCLNLAKRLDAVLEETPFFHAVYRKAVELFLKESPLLSGFAELSAQPERIFPENARKLSDNYGII